MNERGHSFEEAVEEVRPSMLFTTHTPVPAGIDRFPHDLMGRYFGWWCDATGVPMSTLLALGSEPQGDPNVFNLAHMSLRLCGRANGVAELHGDVSRKMFNSLWPGVPSDEVPIGSVTNGVHASTFMSPEIESIIASTVGPDWQTASPEQFRAVHAVDDAELWAARNAGRKHLVSFVRRRTAAHTNALNPEVLTIGFARRFATYKRATLILSDLERLRRLLLSDTPIQLVFAGKAHPADEPGKELLHRIAELATDSTLGDRVVFVEDYDLDAGRMLTRGVDVWLNNPLRPMEACGTSGMKAALNGVLNLSVLDGWWDEAYDPRLGWEIPTSPSQDPTERDRFEADALYNLLEQDVIPLFYTRDSQGVPTGWTTKMASCLERLVPRFHAGRMVREYALDYYVPAAERSAALLADDSAQAKHLAAWRKRVTDAWPEVHVTSVTPPIDPHSLEELTVEAEVVLGQLDTSEVAVEFAYGSADSDGEIHAPVFVRLDPAGDGLAPGSRRFAARFSCEAPGVIGYAVRVIPHNAMLESWTDLGLIRWAD
jgi:starch phosphorylase